MKTLHSIKRLDKNQREKKILLGLVDYYLRSGKPVGSNSLKEAGFDELSSATIRNYFAQLEKEGYLTQAHISGGRAPTPLAFRLYAQEYVDQEHPLDTPSVFAPLKEFEGKEIAPFLQQATELLSQQSSCAVFLSAPRFDQDFITDMKLVSIDPNRCLVVLISDFGVIQTELMQLPARTSSIAIRRMEMHLQAKLRGSLDLPPLEENEELFVQEIYKEAMLRYLVSYSTFTDEDIHRTGFSRLLHHEDFQETAQLAASLSLFENLAGLRLLLRETKHLNRLKFWIGEELAPYTRLNPNCAALAIPFYLRGQVAGAVGLLGPIRLPYRQLFPLLRQFSMTISHTLTHILCKFRLSFRQPGEDQKWILKEEQRLLGHSRLVLLDHTSQNKES